MVRPVSSAYLRFYSVAIFFLIFHLLFSACHKKDDDAETILPTDGIIEGHVKHHERPILGSMVYIKRGSHEFPGNIASVYDDSVQTSGAMASFRFDGLKAGDYYLFARGFDDHIQHEVIGGIPATVSGVTLMELDVPVTE